MFLSHYCCVICFKHHVPLKVEPSIPCESETRMDEARKKHNKTALKRTITISPEDFYLLLLFVIRSSRRMAKTIRESWFYRWKILERRKRLAVYSKLNFEVPFEGLLRNFKIRSSADDACELHNNGFIRGFYKFVRIMRRGKREEAKLAGVVCPCFPLQNKSFLHGCKLIGIRKEAMMRD